MQVAAGSVGITNTIFIYHDFGIVRTGGTVYQDYNLFSQVGFTTTGSIAGGAHSLVGQAGLASPASGNFHLSNYSDAVNTGTNVGVAVDFEGQPRPLGGGFDMGYDEYLNLAPVAFPDTYTAPSSIPLVVAGPGVLIGDYDPNFDRLTAVLVTGPASGSLSLALDGGFIYTPTLGASGPITFTYRASDGGLTSAPVLVTINLIDDAQRLYLPLILR